MKSFPILPIWLMLIICIIFFILILPTKSKKQLLVRMLIIILIFIINLRFMVPTGKVSVYKSNYDIIFVVDNTISMVAEDYNNSQRRLDAVKDDIKYIMNKLPSSDYCFITFDNNSFIRAPFTPDKDTIEVIVDTMDVKKSFYSAGTNITIFKDNLKQMLLSSNKKDNHKRVVFLITDGENTSGKKLESLNELSKYINEGAVLGYGTRGGGYMKESIYEDEVEYIEDRTGEYPYHKAVSKLDESNLKKFASELGIDYIHMERQNNINSKINEINRKMELSQDEEKESYEDLYYYFAWPLTALILLELYYDKREYI